MTRFASIAPVAASLLLAVQVTSAQSRRMMIMERDDGGESEVMHFSMPDMESLLQPEYTMEDLPTFEQSLLLSEPQGGLVGSLIEGYLESFKALKMERMKDLRAGGPVMVLDSSFMDPEGNDFVHAPGPGPGHGPGHGPGIDVGIDEIVREAAGEDGNTDGPREVAVVIGVVGDGPGGAFIPGGGGGGEGGETEGDGAVWTAAGADGEAGATVQISVGGGGELSPEMMEKLQAKAEQMARQLEERLAEQEANGGGMPLLGPGVSMEDHRAQLEEMAASAEAFEKEKAALGQKLIQDVQIQLSPEQMELWPVLERALTRRKTLPDGRLDGERTDLFVLLDRFELDDAQRDAIAEALTAYEMDLDGALTRRNEFIPDAGDRIGEAMSAGDVDKAIALMDKAARLRVAVRDVNARYSETIAESLGDETGGAFREAALRNAHPRIYRKTLGRRAFEAANRIDSLDAEVAAVIGELEAEYERELEQANESIRQTTLKSQPDEPKRSIVEVRSRLEQGDPMTFGMNDDEDPIRAAFDRRDELDRRYLARLKSLLTPEQAAQMPKPRKKREPFIIEIGGAN